MTLTGLTGLSLRGRHPSGDDHQLTPRLGLVLRYVEHGFYLALAAALSAGGVALFAHVVYRFVAHPTGKPFVDHVLALKEGLLLVFIVTELLHTVRAILDNKLLTAEPFLVVGIVAAIRRLIVISAEAPDYVGESSFSDLMLEMGLLVAAVVALGITIAVLHRGTASGGDQRVPPPNPG